MNERLNSYLEKRGFVGKLIGRAITSPFRFAGRAAAAGAGDVAGVVQRASTKNPIGFLGASALGLPTLAALPSPRSPDILAERYKAQQLVENVVNPMKVASSVLSQNDLEQSLKIRGRLEKLAAPNFAEQLAEARKLVGRVAPEEIDMMTALRAAAREERDIAQHAKEMRQWTPGRLLLAGLGIGTAATAVGAGSQAIAQGAGLVAEKAREATANKRYQAMLKADPSLKDNPMSKKYFSILDRASPYIAGEPYLAAATVQQMVSTPSLQEGGVPAIQPKMLQELLKTEEVRQQTRFPFLPKGPTSLRDVATFGA